MTQISPGTIIVGIFAVLFGLIGAYAVRQHLAPKPAPQVQAPVAPPLQVVPIASTDIEPGRPLTMGDVAVLRMNQEQIAEKKLPSHYMTVPSQIIGRVLREPIKQGEVFLATQMYPKDMLPTVAQRLSPGLRAVTVPMQDNGLASPGSVIDVIFRSVADPERQRPQATVTLLEGVEILAVGRNEVPGRRGESAVPTTVTLAVTSEQANALKVVEGHGEFHLAMRSPDDGQASPAVRPQTLNSLLGLATPTVYATEIYRGTTKTQNNFVADTGDRLSMTRFPIGPNRVVSGDDSQPEVTTPTSLRNGSFQPTSEISTSPSQGTAGRASSGTQPQPTSGTQPQPTSETSTSPSQGVKRGLSGLPLLSEAESGKQLDLAHLEAHAGAE